MEIAEGATVSGGAQGVIENGVGALIGYKEGEKRMKDDSQVYPLVDVTERILAAALEVHRTLGPGMLEGTYRSCLAHELSLNGMPYAAEVAIPVGYKGVMIQTGYRADLIVADTVIVELKSVEALMPVHEAQLLTYLRHSKLRVGLLINFNVRQLRHGIKRLICPRRDRNFAQMAKA